MMRFFPAVLLLIASAIAQTTTSPANSPQSIPVDQENAKKARALVDEAILELGSDAYMNIQDMTQEGRSYTMHHGQSEGAGILFWRFYKYPDKDRVELTKQRDVVEIFNGDKGYEITYKGTRGDDAKTMADYLRRQHYSLDWVLRKWLKEPGIALFYEGATVAAQKDAQQVTIMNSKDEAVTLYFDTNTHLPVKKTFSWRDPTDQQRNIEEEVYDNYRPVQGIMTPFSVTRYYNGDMASQRFLHSVSYNTGLKDSLFEASIINEPGKGASKK